MSKILLLEDDQSLSKGIQLSLKKEGYEVIICSTIVAAKKVFFEQSFNLLISDITLPDGNGLDFCQEVRRHSNILILILTSHKEEYEIVSGYEQGADDYVTKPFSLMVLISKINALFKRVQNNRGNILHSNDLTLNPAEMKVTLGDEVVVLSKTELQLLLIFLENPQQILSQEQLLETIWDTKEGYIDRNTIPVNISRLRQKVGKENIKTIRGVGYLWVNAVQRS
ncbi:response regulator transcription factor [Enterococcus sp. AZ103]|uniref:response regulator transcription factor n=1 Tax=Enterococcus sp. AZ103 TaxID=2774628 RepID=UPI003F2466F3